jgi:hypothetical protein
MRRRRNPALIQLLGGSQGPVSRSAPASGREAGLTEALRSALFETERPEYAEGTATGSSASWCVADVSGMGARMGKERRVDQEWLRREFIVAMASDDELVERVVLKGGNALNLIHGVGSRVSLDLDYSMDGALGAGEVDRVGARLKAAFERRLLRSGLVVFDWSFGPRPKEAAESEWGGYRGEFKLIEQDKENALREDLAGMRRQALSASGSGQGPKVFRVEISKYEYCGAKEATSLEGFTFYVYTLAMVVVEKLRALCQQMEGYEGGRGKRVGRARDFYDIHAAVTLGGVDLEREENRELLRLVFEAKAVPLRLLGNLPQEREFHRGDWPGVEASVGGEELRGFDFYFDFVVEVVKKLEPLWMEHPPGGV